MRTTISPLSVIEILDTVAASGGDVSLSNGVFYLDDVKICKYSDIIKASITASVSETAGKETLTFTAANNSDYAIIVQQYNPATAQMVERSYYYTTAASGDTANTIATAFADQINADTANGILWITATDGATLVLDTDTGYPIMFVNVLLAGGGVAQATTGPDYIKGIAAVGTTAALALQGITVTNAAYTTIYIEYRPVTGTTILDSVRNVSTYTLYINEGDGDYSDLVTVFTYLLQGRNASATANSEAIAII